jgi:hypothetical protein
MHANASGGPWSPIRTKGQPDEHHPREDPGTAKWCGIEDAAGLLAVLIGA